MTSQATQLTLVALGKPLLEITNTAIKTYREVKEMEVRYRAFRDALENHQNLVETYLDKVFKERRLTLESYLEKIDAAVQNQDYQALTVLVGGILAVLQQNPLHNFENFKAALADPNVTLEL